MDRSYSKIWFTSAYYSYYSKSQSTPRCTWNQQLCFKTFVSQLPSVEVEGDLFASTNNSTYMWHNETIETEQTAPWKNCPPPLEHMSYVCWIIKGLEGNHLLWKSPPSLTCVPSIFEYIIIVLHVTGRDWLVSIKLTLVAKLDPLPPPPQPPPPAALHPALHRTMCLYSGSENALP